MPKDGYRGLNSLKKYKSIKDDIACLAWKFCTSLSSHCRKCHRKYTAKSGLQNHAFYSPKVPLLIQVHSHIAHQTIQHLPHCTTPKGEREELHKGNGKLGVII